MSRFSGQGIALLMATAMATSAAEASPSAQGAVQAFLDWHARPHRYSYTD